MASRCMKRKVGRDRRARRCYNPKVIFRNGRLICPDGIRDGLELVVRDGRISELRKAGRDDGEEVIDLGGNFLAPGFIDMHVHGALGRDTMEARLMLSPRSATSMRAAERPLCC